MTTITIHVRPTFRWYQEKPCKSFGFSGRAAYALGYDKPNYPVPAIRYKVCHYASNDCIEIRSWKGIGSNKSLIDKIWWKPVD